MGFLIRNELFVSLYFICFMAGLVNLWNNWTCNDNYINFSINFVVIFFNIAALKWLFLPFYCFNKFQLSSLFFSRLFCDWFLNWSEWGIKYLSNQFTLEKYSSNTFYKLDIFHIFRHILRGRIFKKNFYHKIKNKINQLKLDHQYLKKTSKIF